ncbi:hypothetical protein [Salinibacter ruber]|uniref:hypothetical protein n=1 Tax=Salinibacter ruber TaxID=146919 RepID=UPI002168008B|nr:hypothetical protein [Salinibacter ruber]MCS3698272.1 hypothetical protein [Salinibacter ruber]
MSDDIRILKHKIDPDQPDAHRFEDKKEIFFQDEFKEALTSICEHIDRLDGVEKTSLQNPEEPLPEGEAELLHRHSTIGIFGPRGVGKTSFLLTLKNTFDSESGDGLFSDFDLDWTEKITKEVKTLDTIDPSRIENEDKLLVTITSTVLDLVRRNNDGDLQNNRAIQDALEDLSRRFRILFPDATENVLEETASDPLRFAGEVLFDANSGPKLAKAFHRFLALAAKDLGVKCFLLPIDDVDTSFDKGWPLLETLRKYLSTDRLITVVSGDLELFELIVQQKAHKRTKTFREAEKEYVYLDEVSAGANLRRKYGAIRRFPGQYLQKIFPTNNRVRLPDIHSVLLDSNNRKGLLVETKRVRDNNESEFIPLRSAILILSRLLYGTPHTKSNNNSVDIFTDTADHKSKDDLVVDLSRRLGSNSIDSIIPPNTRRFISFLEDLPSPLEMLVKDQIPPQSVADQIRNQISENHSSLLRTSGLDVEDLERIKDGGGYRNLSRSFFQATISSVDLAGLRTDLFRDHDSFDQWRALLSLVAGALYSDWSSTLTGPLRYAVKVKDPLSVSEERNVELDTLGTGLNEPSWKSRCRLLRTVFSDEWETSGRVESLGTAMRVPRKQRDSYTDDNTFVNISPEVSGTSPDYLRWWKEAYERGDGENKFADKNSAVMPESKFLRCTDENAKSVYGIFRVAFKRGSSNYRYIDFRKGLARIDDFVREYINRKVGHNKNTKLRKVKKQIDVSNLVHEPTDFVLRLRGDIESDNVASESEDKEIKKEESRLESKDKKERLRKFREIANIWCSLAEELAAARNTDFKGSIRSGMINIIPGANIVPSPWTSMDAYDLFLANCDIISDLKWRQHTVGTMLERYTMAFWNSILQKEIQFRASTGGPEEELLAEIDFGPVKDNRKYITYINGINDGSIEWSENKNPENSFTRNVSAIVKFSENQLNENRSLAEIIPYTTFWICCPFLLPVLSNEIYAGLVNKNKHSKSDTDSFLQSVRHSIPKEDSKKSEIEDVFDKYISKIYRKQVSNRPVWQRSSFDPFKDKKKHIFDIHDILTGIARPDQAGSSLNDEEIKKDEEYLKYLGLS